MKPDQTHTTITMNAKSHCLLLLALTSPLIAQGVVADGAYFAYGTGIGNGDFHVSVANGQTEIIVPCGAAGFGSGSRYWILHRYNPTTVNYDQVFASPVYDASDAVVKIVVDDVDAMAGPEIVLATAGGTVEIWNQASRALLGTFSAALTNVRSLAVDDVDGDGTRDIVLCSPTTVRACELDGTVLWTVTGAGGYGLTIGQMDGDPALEVAVTDGSVIDCATESVQWQWGNGFGIDIESADIDGDGLDEVIFGEDWNWVWAFDIDVQLPKWSLSLGDIACITLANVDSDPAIELLVGEGQWGDVLIFDTVTQQQQAMIPNSEHGVTSVAVGDVDNDGVLEVIWGAGWTSTGPDYWFVASAATQQIEWTSPDITTGFVGPVRGDVDNDGSDELVCGAPSLNGNGSHILIFDAATLTLEHLSPAVSSTYGTVIRDIELADVDGNGDLEIFMADNKVTCFDYNGTSLTQLWQVGTSGFSGPVFRQIAVADIDGDGNLEVVVGGNQYLHVFDYGGTAELWHSFYLGGEVRDVSVGDTDGNQGLELHALSTDGNIYVFDGPTWTARAILQDGGVNRTAMHVLDGLPALITGDDLGHMYLYIGGGSGYVGIGPLPVATARIDGLGYYPSLGLLQVAADQRLALQFGLFPGWRTVGYGDRFASKVALDLASGRLATAGPFGLTVFDL